MNRTFIKNLLRNTAHEYADILIKDMVSNCVPHINQVESVNALNQIQFNLHQDLVIALIKPGAVGTELSIKLQETIKEYLEDKLKTRRKADI